MIYKKFKTENLKLLLGKVLWCIEFALSYGGNRIRIISIRSTEHSENKSTAAVVTITVTGGGHQDSQ